MTSAPAVATLNNRLTQTLPVMRGVMMGVRTTSAAGLSGLSVPAMTGTLKTIYRLPVPLNRELVYQVRMTGEERRKVFMQCTVKDHDGTLYAEGEAIFLKIDPELYAKMGG